MGTFLWYFPRPQPISHGAGDSQVFSQVTARAQTFQTPNTPPLLWMTSQTKSDPGFQGGVGISPFGGFLQAEVFGAPGCSAGESPRGQGHRKENNGEAEGRTRGLHNSNTSSNLTFCSKYFHLRKVSSSSSSARAQLRSQGTVREPVELSAHTPRARDPASGAEFGL